MKEKERSKRKKEEESINITLVHWEIKSEQEKEKKCGGAYVWFDRGSHITLYIYNNALISQFPNYGNSSKLFSILITLTHFFEF